MCSANLHAGSSNIDLVQNYSYTRLTSRLRDKSHPEAHRKRKGSQPSSSNPRLAAAESPTQKPIFPRVSSPLTSLDKTHERQKHQRDFSSAQPFFPAPPKPASLPSSFPISPNYREQCPLWYIYYCSPFRPKRRVRMMSRLMRKKQR